MVIVCQLTRSLNRANAATAIETYGEFVKKNSLASEIVDLSDGTQGVWLGDKSEGTVILWLHGALLRCGIGGSIDFGWKWY